ncbi:zinc finger protein [Aphelenchoides avenae]|nr:zinc finger protein [Aphelenchus avenae]
MIANLISKDALLYANRKMMGDNGSADMLAAQGMNVFGGGGPSSSACPSGNQMQMSGGGSDGHRLHASGSGAHNGGTQVVMNGTRLSSSSSDESPPSCSPPTSDALNSLLHQHNQQQQQQQHHSQQSHLSMSGQRQSGIVTNGSGLLNDSTVDITGLLNHQLKTEPFDVSGILGMSHINGHLQNVSLAGPSGVSHLSASSSLGSLPGLHFPSHSNVAGGGLVSGTSNASGLPSGILSQMQSPSASGSGLHGVNASISQSSAHPSAPGVIRQRHRSSTNDSMMKCTYCPKKFPNQNVLRSHMEECRMLRVHECSQCGKRFKARGGLQQHNRIHLQDRPYQCHYCPKRFTQKSHVDQHERIHTGLKPFSCQFCGRAFRQRSQQMGHEATHANSGMLPNSLNLHGSGGGNGQSHSQHMNAGQLGRNTNERHSMSSDQTSCQDSPIEPGPSGGHLGASNNQMQQNMMDKNDANAMLSMLCSPNGGTQLAADSLLALKHGSELQQTLELISGR